MILRKTLSLSMPMKVYNMLNELAQITYSTKTKVIIDAIRKEYMIYKNFNSDIGGQNEILKEKKKNDKE